ncbi:hypothetical protein BFV93_4837 [Alteromonas macleodii]|nr:hypothetical protein BFV93_4837 [Alteromonas macleodii]
MKGMFEVGNRLKVETSGVQNLMLMCHCVQFDDLVLIV